MCEQLRLDMQARHDEEAAALAKRRANFQRDRDQLAKEAETEYEDACERAAFKLQVLSPSVDISCAWAVLQVCEQHMYQLTRKQAQYVWRSVLSCTSPTGRDFQASVGLCGLASGSHRHFPRFFYTS